MSALNNSALIGASGSTGYQISRSVRLRSSASAYLNRTFTTPTNAAKWTFNRWVKRGAIGARQSLFAAGTSGSSYANIEFKADDTIQFLSENSAVQFQLVTTQVFRDPSAWYNIHIIYDSANATSTDRIQLWINGVRVTAFSTATYPTTTPNNLFNTAIAHQIGVLGYGSVAYFDGYQTELNFIDGQALTPSSFGETNPVTGVWQPKKYAGTYGTNGFFLNFSDNSAATAAAIGKDYSGNGNNWTPNNISVTAGVTYDSMLDVPTQWADGGNGRGNYFVLNPLSASGYTPYSDGNLKYTSSALVAFTSVFTTTGGKWYYECTAGSIATPANFRFGFVALYFANGNIFVGGSVIATVSSYTAGDIIGVATDSDANTVSFYKNNVLQGTYSASLNASMAVVLAATAPDSASFNFGQRPFTYTPPSGFKALNTLNLPTPTILKGNLYFDAVTYSGNSTYPRTIGGLNFQPDLVWQKARSVTYDHIVYDSARGTGTSKSLSTNITSAEGFNSTFANLTAFASDGFTVDTTSSTNVLNNAGQTYVAWQWKEGATQGFDIVLYTGTGAARTVAHNLGVAPDMIIVKNRSDGTVNWRVYHKSIGATNFLSLNLTNASAAASSVWNNTAPTSTVFSVANDGGSNGNGNNLVAYLFAEIAGFSKFGTYTGNGSTDGPFVFCGFRPRFLMFKRTDALSQWLIIDTARSQYNQTNEVLLPSTSAAEANGAGYGAYDILSNGFKPRNVVANDTNVNGGTYIFAAFAENPFKNALAR